MDYDITIRFNEKTNKWRVKLPMVTPTQPNTTRLRTAFWMINSATGEVAEFNTQDEAFEMVLRHYA